MGGRNAKRYGKCWVKRLSEDGREISVTGEGNDAVRAPGLTHHQNGCPRSRHSRCGAPAL
jgi:hypothetical protein